MPRATDNNCSRTPSARTSPPAGAELASFTKLYSRDTGEKTPPATLLPIGKWSAPSASLAPPPVRTRGMGVTPVLILPTLFRPPVAPAGMELTRGGG
jgi:hypothetical protein